MKYRTLGRTGYKVSEISFGAWAVGGSWGQVDDEVSLKAMRHAVEKGVNFFDTADVYGDGRSEKLIAKLAKEVGKDKFRVATKAGRRLNPHVAAGYTAENVLGFIERSLKNLETDCLDLVQLHCPPTEVYYLPEFFDGLAKISKSGKVRHWGASVAKVEEGLKAIEYDVITTIQIIFNCFRQRPAGLFFEQVVKRNVGVLARVPLSSGLLTGRLTRERVAEMPKDDHRNFNRAGAAFDYGETYSGLGGHMEAALAAVEELRPLTNSNRTMTQLALRWILDHPAVTCAIPGAKTADQVDSQVAASDLAPLDAGAMEKIRRVYQQKIGPLVHDRW